MTDDTAGAPPTTDWDAVGKEFRAGIRSLRDIAAEHRISESGLRKHARREGWERDLTARIKARADALVRKEAVRMEERAAHRASERELVEANATALTQVILTHRADIARARAVVQKLLGRLDVASGLGDLDIQSLIGAVEQDSKRASEQLEKILGIPALASNVKALSDALKTVIGLEREAFGLDKGAAPPGDEGARASVLSAEDRDLLLSVRTRFVRAG